MIAGKPPGKRPKQRPLHLLLAGQLDVAFSGSRGASKGALHPMMYAKLPGSQPGHSFTAGRRQ